MPNIDIVKIAIVVVLLAVVVGLLSYLTGLEVGAGSGRAAWEALNAKPEAVTGQHMSWGPLSIFTELIPSLSGDGSFNFPALMAGIFASALIAALVALLIKVIMRVIGA